MTTVTYNDVSPSGVGTLRMDAPRNKYPQPSPLDGADEYTKRVDKRGREMFFKNGTIVSKLAIPESVTVIDLDETEKMQAEGQTVARPSQVAGNIDASSLGLSNKECLWEDGPGERMRFVSGQMVYLCTDHYDNSTVGKVVQKLQDRLNNGSTDK